MSDEKTSVNETEEATESIVKEIKTENPVVEETKEEASSEETKETTDEEEVVEEVKELPYKDLRSGMVVRVHEKITETNAKGVEKKRVQIFEGLILNIKGNEISKTMTIRKDSKGFIVEKIYPLSSPNIEKVEFVKRYKTRRGNISFLRNNFKRKLKEDKTK